MGKTAEALRRLARRRTVLVVGVIVFIGFISVVTSPQVGRVLEGLSAPRLPPYQELSNRVWLNQGQGWDLEISDRFHHISQGTHTLPLPFEWLQALERPAGSIFTMPFGDRGRFLDDEYILRFGFIKGKSSEENPLNEHGLPLGFALTYYENLPGISNKVTAVGFNCAACHTGRIAYGGTEYIVEGGPAVTDLGLMTKALGAALGQTLISAKLRPLVNGRFDRFARRVLGDDGYDDQNTVALESELENLVLQLASEPKRVAVVEGFGRLDALNRIGNQVFALDLERFENYVPPDAPVNYPHIWSASWFDWVQYDGSIMQPLVRNTGEALGVRASVNTTAPHEENRFSSSVPIGNLWWIENALSGGKQPYPVPSEGDPEKVVWSGLKGPTWPWPEGSDRPSGLPESYPDPAIDPERAKAGKDLYDQHCTHCHLGPIDSGELWTHFKPISYFDSDGREQETRDKVLYLPIIPVEEIGTDPAQGNVLVHRTVNTAGDAGGTARDNTRGMGIDQEICGWEPGPPTVPFSGEPPPSRLVHIRVEDNPDFLFAYALGAIVQGVNDEWFAENHRTPPGPSDKQPDPAGEDYRPNCLQAGKGYRVRPHDGIWATAPFLHNGSVPTVFDLLSPVEERPRYVQLGKPELDTVKLGLKQDPDYQGDQSNLPEGEKYDRNGYFILDTHIAGNSNAGHEFSDRWKGPNPPEEPILDQEKGVIGPALTDEERFQIIEYLKTL